MSEWSNSFHGVTHLEGMKRGFQVTVTDRGSFAEVWMKVPGSGFAGVYEEMHANVEQAKADGERIAKSYDALLRGAA